MRPECRFSPDSPYETGVPKVSAMLGTIKNKVLWAVASILLAAPRSAFACAACTGRSDDAAVQGLNAAIFTMLAVLLVVLGAFLSFMAYLVRRAAKHPLALPSAPGGTVQ